MTARGSAKGEGGQAAPRARERLSQRPTRPLAAPLSRSSRLAATRLQTGQCGAASGACYGSTNRAPNGGR